MNLRKMLVIVTVAVIAAALVSASVFAFVILPNATQATTLPGTTVPSTTTAPNTVATQPATATALTINDAATVAQNYVTQLGNSNLAVKEVDEYQQCFYAQVVEKNTGAGAFELTIDKYSGAVAAEQGAMMMWNTKYGINSAGMMGYLTTGTGGGMMRTSGMMTWLRGTPTTSMTVAMDQAKTTAQQYLNTNYPGTTVGQTTTFYGYYMIQVLKEGSIYGMVTVNGQTGQALYCTGFGTFMQQRIVIG